MYDLLLLKSLFDVSDDFSRPFVIHSFGITYLGLIVVSQTTISS